MLLADATGWAGTARLLLNGFQEFLVMRQVMPIASSLASGAALNTMGTISRAANWGARTGFEVMRFGRRHVAALIARGMG